LINKAIGWLLREVGKRNKTALEGFLVEHINTLPNVTLSYAMEKMDREQKNHIKSFKT